MLFPTVTFAVFFMVAMPIAWLTRGRPVAHRLVLITAGGFFYAWWDVRFLALLALVVVVNDRAAAVIERGGGSGRRALVAGIGFDLALLGVFKYYGFFVTSLREMLHPIGLEPPLPLLEVILPVGISFFTFEAIAYLIEVRREVIRRVPLLDLATHLSFFPKLVSGPITRPSELVPQLENGGPHDVDAARAFWLFARGLFKKVVIATYLAEAIADPVFNAPSQHSALEALAAIYGYTAQLYIDFSAYTDMAIALALLLGYRLPENFRAPYRATSLHDFWDRWHISLSRWIRDFLFQPMYLAFRKRGHRGTAVLMVVMLLVGLWHGAGWTFVVWGAIHGAVLSIERLARVRRRRLRTPQRASLIRRTAGVVVTFHVVAAAWVFFRAPSIPAAIAVFGRLGSWGPAPLLTPMLLITLGAVFAAQWVPEEWSAALRGTVERLSPAFQVAGLAALLLVVEGLGPAGVPPFIYFKF